MARSTRKQPRPLVRNRRPPAAPSPSVAVLPFDATTYEELFENAHEAIVLFALDGTMLLVNGKAERLLQRPRAEIIGHHFRDFATPESVALADHRTQEFLAGRTPPSSVFDLTLLRKDGTTIPVEARTRVMTDASGKPFRFQGSFRDLTERRRREAAATPQVPELRAERESYFQALIEYATDMIVVVDREGQVQYNNPSCQTVLGYDLTEATGRSGFDFVHPEDRSAVAEAFTALLATPHASVALELRMRHKDGSWRVLAATATNLLTDPAVNGIVINSHDVTARKERETRYRRVSEFVSDYAFALHLDAQGTIFVDWLTDNFVEVSRVPVDQVIGTPNAIEQYIHPDDHDTIRHTLMALQPGERTTYDFRLVRPDGSERRMRSTVCALTKDTEGISIEGATRDITNVQDSELKQEQRADRFRQLVELAPDVMFTLAADGTLTHLNAAFEHYTQWTIGEWLNEKLELLLHPDDKSLAAEVLLKLLNKEAVPSVRLRMKTKSGGYRIGDYHATAKIEHGEVVSILGISRDMTERVQVEEALGETRRMHAMIVDTVPDVIGVYDIPQDRVVYINAPVWKVLGVPPHDLLDKGIAALQQWIPEEDHPWVSQRYQQLVGAGEPVEVEHGVLHRNGEKRWLYSRAVVCHKTREGKPDQILVVGQDITTRKRLGQLMQSQVVAMQELPERLRKFRERLGMTQSEFGREFASRNGPYNSRQMSSYETGETVMPLELLVAIRAKGFAVEGVLGVGPTDVVEKTMSYFSSKRAEQAVMVQLLRVLLRFAEGDQETIESALKELNLPGRELTRGETKLLEEVQNLGIPGALTRE